MSLNESIVEDAALEWFGELGYAFGHLPAPRSATGRQAGRISHPVNQRRSGIRFLRWCWWGACARPSGG